MEEVLNIDYHKARLIIKSLNKSNNFKDAAKLCGIHKRTLYNWIRIYEIKKIKNEWIKIY
jgi:transposase